MKKVEGRKKGNAKSTGHFEGKNGGEGFLLVRGEGVRQHQPLNEAK